MAKRRAEIADIAVDRCRPEKLRVIEGVKGLNPEQQRLRFRHGKRFCECHVVVVHPGAVEKAAVRSSGRAQSIDAEQCSAEVLLIIFPRVTAEVQRSQPVIRQIESEIVDAVGFCAQQGIIAEAVQRDWEAAAEARDAGERPTFGPAIRG